ncbi:MAG: heparinase II/III family protein, partial [Firmicutes bacterium]|nr:heparinase II/III family protein [Bacillota bacterium]
MKKSVRLMALLLMLAFAFIEASATLPVFADGEALMSESFEGTMSPKNNLPKHWEYSGGDNTIEVTDEKSSNGSKSLKMIDISGTDSNEVTSKQFRTTPGKYYLATVDIYNSSGVCELYVNHFTSDLYKVDYSNVTSSTSGEWETLELAFEGKASVSFVRFLLYQSSVNIGTAYFDNFTLTEITEDEYNEKTGVEFKVFECLANDSHPRLNYTADDLDELKSRAKDTNKPYGNVSGKEMAKEIFTQADLYLAEKSFFCHFVGDMNLEFTLPLEDLGKREELQKPPEGYGSYPYWTYISRLIQQRMQTLALASVITDDSEKSDAYAAKAIEYSDSLCSWDWWSDKNYDDGTTCLDTAHLTYAVINVYDMLNDRLSDQQKAAYQKAIYLKAIVPLTEAAANRDNTNVQVMRVSALTSACCVVMGEVNNEIINGSLNEAKNYLKWYIDQVSTTGNHEGLLYTTYCVEYAMVAFDHLKRVTGDDDLLNNEYISDFLMKWAVAAGENTNNYTALISDSTNDCSFDVTASILCKQYDNKLAGYYLKKRGCATSGFNAYIYHCDEIDVEEPSNELQSVYLSKIGWGSMRTGWDVDDSLLVFTSSKSNMWHNHWDNQNFVLALGGTWLTTDPGYASNNGSAKDTYTWSQGHTGLYIDSAAQTVKGSGYIYDNISGGFISSMTGDATLSYDKKYGIEKYYRHFTMVNHSSPYYLITDDITTEKPHSFTARINISDLEEAYADGEALPFNSTTDAGKLCFVGDTATLGVSVDSGANTIRYGSYQKNGTSEEYGKLLDITSKQDAAQKEFITALTPILNDNISVDFTHYWEHINYGDNDAGDIVGGTAEDGHGYMSYLPFAQGASFTAPIPVPKEGKYNVTFNFVKRDDFGKWDIYLDNEKLTSYDAYADSETYSSLDLGEFKLSAGNHMLRFVSVEPGANGGYGIALSSFEGQNSNGANDLDKLDTLAEVSENLSDDNAIACKVIYGENKTETDLIAYARATSEAEGLSVSGLETDGSEAGIYGLTDSGFNTGYSVAKATNLSYNGKTIVESDKPVSVAVNFTSVGSINAFEDSTVMFQLPSDDAGLKGLRLNGEEVNLSDAKDGMITLSVTAGNNYLEFDYSSNTLAIILIIV